MKVAYAEEQRQHAINPLRPSYQKKRKAKSCLALGLS